MFLFLIVTSLVLLEPDVGMTIMLSAIWGVQIFIAGISFIYVFILLNLFFVILFVSYFFFPHVAKRIDGFLSPEAESNYQINRALLAIENGGVFGKGPGEGVIKNSIPDSHADFIFAVIGEELGLIVAIILILTYSFLVCRGFFKLLKEKDIFVFYAVSGLLIQIAFQSIINIGVTVKLLPAKGMTLPFISYGGSSMMAIAINIGFILALTRKKY
jgi:cell division protein FtsW